MLNKTKCIFLFCLFLANISFGQQNFWTAISENQIAAESADRQIIPTQYQTFQLNFEGLKDQLQKAPMRFTVSSAENDLIVTLPMPDGTFEHFKVLEAPTMHPDLQSRFPGIRSFAGEGIEDPTAYLRCGFSHKGFHAMVISGKRSSVFIDVYAKGTTTHYISYFKKDFVRQDGAVMECSVGGEPVSKSESIKNKQNPANLTGSNAENLGDCQLRTYRLALACTGEYATFHGGNVPDVLAEYNVAMTRVNGVYETDATITMELIANTDELIYLDAGTDPYSNGSGGAMLGENIATCNSVIGQANYDIGHVFSTGGGGVAGLGVVCGNAKARGVTGLPSPIGDPFYIDYVSHEMGHQFGGNHTQNNSCNRVNAAAVEPGSASTIMGYAGICNPNVQNNSDDHFHAYSLFEIDNFVQNPNSGGSCPVITPLDNNAPTVTTAATSYNLPVSTPFMLTAIGDDVDGDMLTYCWEQMDNEIATMPPQPTNTGGPAFRSISPHESPTRYCPNINAIIANQTPTWEVVPSVSRNMDFRCTVRDNAPGAGCQAITDVDLDFHASAGPFLVLEPNTADIIWQVGTVQTINWDVANTDQAPVSCENVDILLSTDGGLTYPIILASQVPNNGMFDITVPNNLTTEARVQVVCSSNIFFDISNEDFTIEEPPAPTFFLNILPVTQTLCQTEEATYTIDLTTVLGFDEEITIDTSNVPANVTVTFTNNPIIPPGTLDVTFANLSEATPGTYTITLNATSTSVDRAFDIELTIVGEVTELANLISPTDGESGTIPNPELTWEAVPHATSYTVEISDNPSFSNILETANVDVTNYQPQNIMGANEVFYWRVSAMNICNEGEPSDPFALQTGGKECTTFSSPNLPLNIPGNSSGDFSTSFEIVDDFLISDLNTSLEIAHTWVGDLRVTLESPTGTSAIVFDQPGFPASNFGCDGDNIVASFDDDATATSDDFENTCEGSDPTIQGAFQPVDGFAAFNGENSAGMWTLTVFDAFDEDGGAVNVWDLELCKSVATDEPELTNEIFTVIGGTSKDISNMYLAVNDMNPADVRFTLLNLPQNGTLNLSGMELAVGDQFSQEDIDNLFLSYEHDGSNTMTDNFVFDVLGSDNGWLHGRTFQIIILQNDLGGVAVLDNDIDCNNANNAQISVLPSGGTMPFEYSINGIDFQPENSFSNLEEGIYSVTVRDANGFEITTNEIIVSNPPALSVDATVNNNDLTGTGSGGTGSYTYSINGLDFQNEDTFPDLPNGVYTLTIMDANGCTAETTAIIAIDDLLVNATITNQVSCNGENDAVVEINAAGGIPPYTYHLGDEEQSGNTFTDVEPGTYTVMVVDSDGTSSSGGSVTITEPDPLSVNASFDSYIITASGQGGTAPYQYSLNGAAFQSGNEFQVSNSGDYTIYILDANDCESEVEIEVEIEALAGTSSIVQQISCPGEEDGIIEVFASGGFPPYQYSLDGTNFQDENTFENLSSGSYIITIKDAGGMTTITVAALSTPNAIFATANVSLGYTITVSANGGTGDFLYSIDGGMTWQDSNVFTIFANGTYDILIQDENGCESTVMAEIDVDALGIEAVLNSPISCHGETDAEILVTSEGGISPYTYSLNGGPFMSTPLFTGLAPGTYTVTTMDFGGNTLPAPPIIIEEPDVLTATADVVSNDVTINPTGGTPGYVYLLNGGAPQVSNVFDDLDNGSHDVVVRDEHGCETTVSFVVNIIVNATIQIENPLCFGEVTGSILVSNVGGGTPPFTFSLNGSPATSTPLFDMLPPGSYDILITDNNGNELLVEDLSIVEPLELTLDPQVDVNNLTINASGGTDPLQYSIDGGMTFGDETVFNGLPNGDYTIVVMDANGCTVEDTININVSGLNDLDFELLFEINPNPGDGHFILKMNQQTLPELEIAVFDVAGKAVYQTKTLKNHRNFETVLDLKNFAEGTYQVIVNDGELYGVKRLVIVR